MQCNDAMAMSSIGYPNAAELVAYAHAALFPALSTLGIALQRGHVCNLPGLTAKMLRQHPPQSVATVKGHLDQVRKNLRSTKPTSIPISTSDPTITAAAHANTFPAHAAVKTHDCYATVLQLLAEPTGKVCADQTGKFPCTSASGNNYVMILFDYDLNACLMEALRNRKGPTMLKVHTRLHTRLTKAGLCPRFIMMDNKCTNALKQFLLAENIGFQLTIVGIHQCNTTERAIQTAKNHLIAGLCLVHPKFPLYLWDKLLPQAELTLNMLHGSRINPKLSACVGSGMRRVQLQLHPHWPPRNMRSCTCENTTTQHLGATR